MENQKNCQGLCERCLSLEDKVRNWNTSASESMESTAGISAAVAGISAVVHDNLVYAGPSGIDPEGEFFLYRCLKCRTWWELYAYGFYPELRIIRFDSSKLIYCTKCHHQTLKLFNDKYKCYTDWLCESCGALLRASSCGFRYIGQKRKLI